MIKYECNLSGEVYYRFVTKAGYPVTVIPKPGHSKIYAMFGTNYGSMDTVCKPIDGADSFVIPDGTAHFLEHKLFEGEKEDAFTRYSRTGANANAFTSCDKTVYLFSCTERFEESFEILLDFVAHPYFTEETVAKEQGIIGQEIKMYDDDPDWRVMMNVMQAMFHNNPARIDTAGTVESIAQITPEMLYACYNTFYNPSNMGIVVCGDIDPIKVQLLCERYLEQRPTAPVKRELTIEPDAVKIKRVVEKRAVSKPQFLIGYKDPEASIGAVAVKKEAMSEILLDMLWGHSSDFYGNLYQAGLINQEFSVGYYGGYGFGASLIGGEAEDPDAILEQVRITLSEAKRNGLDADSFRRAKNKIYGRNMRKLNSVENTAMTFIDLDFLGVDFSEYMDIYRSVTLQDCEQWLATHFTEDHCALSIILPA